jgi:hypothetical protein
MLDFGRLRGSIEAYTRVSNMTAVDAALNAGGVNARRNWHDCGSNLASTE